MTRNKLIVSGLVLLIFIIGIAIGNSFSNGKNESITTNPISNNIDNNSDSSERVINNNEVSNNPNENNTKETKPSGTIDIISNIPSLTNSNQVMLTIKIIEHRNAKTLDAYSGNINKASMLLDSDTIEVPIILDAGYNLIEFKLVGDVGVKSDTLRTAEITLDTKPPRIVTGFLWKTVPFNLSEGEEYVGLNYGEWESFSNPAPIPIQGKVGDNISFISIGGHELFPDENSEIFQRVYLPVPRGLNKYKIIARDDAGNESTANLEMTVVDPDRNQDDEILDRLDDIESQL